MASFAQNLWESIFTPGPTPTLLVATNATFAVLQVLLAALLAATYSVHFLVLSVLCGGLWAAINWFARELREHQQQEEAKEKEKEKEEKGQVPPRLSQVGGAAAAASSSADDSETEVEGTAAGKATGSRRGKGGLRSSGAGAAAAAKAAPAADVAVSTVVEPAETRGEVKLRTVQEVPSPSPSQGHKSGVSTEDEWEKVSEDEKNK